MSTRLMIERPGNPVTRTEWEAWLNATPGFAVTGKIRGANPRTGKPISIPSESAGLWSGPDGKKDGYFQFHEGCIVPLDPDDDMIAEAGKIARALGAKILKK